MSFVLETAQALQDTPFGIWLAESRYAFPIVEGLHLIGLSLSVGLIALIDLRFVRLFLREVPLLDVLQQVRPWVLAGFGLTFLSGIALFAAEATTVIVSPAFPVKFLFLLLAGINALVFEVKLNRLRAVSTGSAIDDSLALFRRAGWASLGLWAVVVASGRLIPYLPH